MGCETPLMGNFGRGLLTILVETFSELPLCLRVFCLPLYSQISDLSQGLKSSFCLLLFPPCLSLTGIFPSKSLVHRISPWWLLLQRHNTEVVAVVQARDDTRLKEEIGRGDEEKWADITCIYIYSNEIMHNNCLLCD